MPFHSGTNQIRLEFHRFLQKCHLNSFIFKKFLMAVYLTTADKIYISYSSLETRQIAFCVKLINKIVYKKKKKKYGDAQTSRCCNQPPQTAAACATSRTVVKCAMLSFKNFKKSTFCSFFAGV